MLMFGAAVGYITGNTGFAMGCMESLIGRWMVGARASTMPPVADAPSDP
jgi:hypothetical protein